MKGELKTEQVNARLAPDLYRRLCAFAEDEERTVGQVVRTAIKWFLDHMAQKGKKL